VRRGETRVDDWRVNSGKVLKSGGRWIDTPPEYGPKTTLYNRYVRWAARRSTCFTPSLKPTGPERTTKIHAPTDASCRPIAFMLTGGNVADCVAGAEQFLARHPACEILHGDKSYDSGAIRRQVESDGAMPNIPPEANRKWKNCFSPFLYRNCNIIERMFCRLKDFWRVATRYDRNAANFLAAVCIAATVSYRL
jgi:transposase